jgi:hypothetical protein
MPDSPSCNHSQSATTSTIVRAADCRGFKACDAGAASDGAWYPGAVYGVMYRPPCCDAGRRLSSKASRRSLASLPAPSLAAAAPPGLPLLGPLKYGIGQGNGQIDWWASLEWSSRGRARAFMSTHFLRVRRASD